MVAPSVLPEVGVRVTMTVATVGVPTLFLERRFPGAGQRKYKMSILGTIRSCNLPFTSIGIAGDGIGDGKRASGMYLVMWVVYYLQ
jgi:hypothetical protein